MSRRPPRAGLRRERGRALLAAGLLALLCAPALARAAAEARAPVHGYEVVASWPHDRAAFTQGLLYAHGRLYESTGRYGESSLRQVELETGRVLRRHDLPARYFGEGIALLDGKIYQLTWRGGIGFVYARETFERVGTFGYEGEGWGLATDGRWLIMSNGSEQLRFLDPHSFRVARTVTVKDGGRPVASLNELEYVRGEVYANIWGRDAIARIDPASGAVQGWIDLSGLHEAGRAGAVLNGIAYDAAGDRLFVTGKLWSRLYQIRLGPRAPRRSP